MVQSTFLDWYIANPKKYGEHPAVKFADANIGGGSGFDTMPLYALGFMNKEVTKNIVEMVDVKNLKVPE